MQTGMGRVEAKIDEVGRKVEYKIERFKKKLLLYTLQLIFITLGILSLIAGALLFFGRFFSYDFIFLIMGAILLYIAMITGWKK